MTTVLYAWLLFSQLQMGRAEHLEVTETARKEERWRTWYWKHVARICLGYNLQCLNCMMQGITSILSFYCVYFRELEGLMLKKDQRKSYFLMLNFHQFVICHFYQSNIFLVWRIQDCDDVQEISGSFLCVTPFSHQESGISWRLLPSHLQFRHRLLQRRCRLCSPRVFTFSFFCCSLLCKISIFECKYKIRICIWKM